MDGLSPRDRQKFQALIQRNLKMRSNIVTLGYNMDLYIQKNKTVKLQQFYNKTFKNSKIEELNQEIADQCSYIKEITSKLNNRRLEYQEMYKIDNIAKQQD